MKVDTTNMREVVFDCPWVGHLEDPAFRLINTATPNVIGLRCAKCGALIYVTREASKLVGPGGEALTAQAEMVEGEKAS
jgi:uncharacterized Zn finger protein